jgi:hypothetical protein
MDAWRAFPRKTSVLLGFALPPHEGHRFRVNPGVAGHTLFLI